MTFFTLLKLLGCLALLMYGMKTMSEALQKLTGGGLRRVLATMTTNRVTGIFSGALVTTAIQSSTATTVLTVSFVSASLLTLAQAISVIMGANIGTTVTAWIIALFGFNFQISALVFPLFALGIMLSYSKSPGTKSFGEFISEIESICDSCYNMGRAINRKNSLREEFTADQVAHLKHIWNLCDEALTQMEMVLNDADNRVDPRVSLNIENEINYYRTQLKEINLTDVNEKKNDYQTGVTYMDIVGDSENWATMPSMWWRPTHRRN